MLTGFAHSAVCVPDVEAATRWYEDVLGLHVLSPPYRMEGEQIEHDMGELVPSPVVVHASIVGFGNDDRVIELIEYPAAGIVPPDPAESAVTRVGITHIGMLCDDITDTRAQLEGRGVEFLTAWHRGRGGLEDDVVPRSLGNRHHPDGEEQGRTPLLGAVDGLKHVSGWLHRRCTRECAKDRNGTTSRPHGRKPCCPPTGSRRDGRWK